MTKLTCPQCIPPRLLAELINGVWISKHHGRTFAGLEATSCPKCGCVVQIPQTGKDWPREARGKAVVK